MTITGQNLIINRADLTDTIVTETTFPDSPPDGQVLLRVDEFALTANTITYGTASDSLGYWNFFPAQQEGYGRIPAWGFADVVASSVAGIAVGERFYGYVPMSTHLMVEPGKVGPGGFMDMAEHRQKMSPIYNMYSRTTADPGYMPDLEPQIALFRPLFTTSFLLADFLRENAAFGAQQVLLSSASSKTAIGLAADLARDPVDGLSVVGLTSPGNMDFVKSLGLYDTVIAYGDLGSLPDAPATYVDFSGNGALLRSIHSKWQDRLCHTAQVGLTDWKHAQLRVPGLPGPKPAFFFAPSQAQLRIKEWGRAGFEAHLGAAWRAFIGTTDWLDLRHYQGPDDVTSRYLTALAGDIDPKTGEMVSMWAG